MTIKYAGSSLRKKCAFYKLLLPNKMSANSGFMIEISMKINKSSRHTTPYSSLNLNLEVLANIIQIPLVQTPFVRRKHNARAVICMLALHSCIQQLKWHAVHSTSCGRVRSILPGLAATFKHQHLPAVSLIFSQVHQ
jgi:hypothetical protein